MIKLIKKWFKIDELEQKIKDLKVTVASLENQVTKTYKEYEKAILFINNIDPKNEPYWWEEHRDYKDVNTYRIINLIKQSKQIEFVEQHKSLKIRKVFHGGCLGCVTPLESGIGTCLKCQYLMGLNSGYKDLSKNERK